MSASTGGLARDIVGHDVRTAHRMGWTAIENGELLSLAAGNFDVFVTVDRDLAFQQNVGSTIVAVIVLRVKTNRLVDLRQLTSGLLEAIESAQPGSITFVGEVRN